MNKKEKIAFIEKSWREKEFYSDTGKNYWKNHSDDFQNDLIDKLFFEAYNKIVQRDMPFVMCDILGFTNKMKEKNNLDIYHDLILKSFASRHEIDQYKLITKDIIDKDNPSYSEIIKLARKPFKVNSIQFSDTIVFYPQILGTIFQIDIDENLTRVFDQILITCTLMMAAKFFADMIRNGILIRGAITYGDFLIQKEPALYISHLVQGVHELELLQDWAGIALSPEIIMKIKEVGLLDEKLTIKYESPVKNKEKFDQLFTIKGINPYVIDWRNLVKLDRELIENEAKDSSGVIAPAVKKKICNTFTFYNFKE